MALVDESKQRMVIDTPEKGRIRNAMFKSVIGRYNKAVKNGYYLEALTLMGSIIGDRLESLLSYLQGEASSLMTLGKLTGQLRHLKNLNVELPENLLTLLDEIDKWARQRNKALHQMAKLTKVNMTETFEQKYAQAQECAEKGIKLFRKVDVIIQRGKRKKSGK